MGKLVSVFGEHKWKIPSLKRSKIPGPQYEYVHGLSTAKNAKLAVIIHLYYTDLWPVMSRYLARISVPFDLYISVRNEDIDITIEKINSCHCNTNIISFPNKGRDVLPFLNIARSIDKKGYSYFLKLHTKKSPHRKDGDSWLKSLLEELIPSNITDIISTLENKDTGSIGPRNHVVSLSKYLGDNRSTIVTIIQDVSGDANLGESIMNKASLYPFFGGTMFWARLDFIEPILKSSISASDFDGEAGQVDGTLAHALERVFGGLLHHLQHRKMYVIKETSSTQLLEEKLYEDDYRYVG